eukprot:3197431-Amphidinium_carterae.1
MACWSGRLQPLQHLPCQYCDARHEGAERPKMANIKSWRGRAAAAKKANQEGRKMEGKLPSGREGRKSQK